MVRNCAQRIWRCHALSLPTRPLRTPLLNGRILHRMASCMVVWHDVRARCVCAAQAVEARLVKALREAEPDGASEATVRERLQRGARRGAACPRRQ